MLNTSLVLLSTAIRQDNSGRYSLNDCHKAAGGEDRHKPSNFLRLDTTQALIGEIEKTTVESQGSDLSLDGKPPFSEKAVDSVYGGANNGTYVVKELVYAYAMWISPAFHLAVIRAFDGIVTAPNPETRSSIVRAEEAFGALLRMSEHIPGYTKATKLISASRATEKLTGHNPLRLLEATVLDEENQEYQFAPRDIGEMLTETRKPRRPYSSRFINDRLVEFGLQTRHRDGNKLVYELTAEGLSYGEKKAILDPRNKERPQVRWSKRVVMYINDRLKNK